MVAAGWRGPGLAVTMAVKMSFGGQIKDVTGSSLKLEAKVNDMRELAEAFGHAKATA